MEADSKSEKSDTEDESDSFDSQEEEEVNLSKRPSLLRTETNGKSSPYSEDQNSLKSLKDYLDTYIKPLKSDYSQFATSYILSSIPSYTITCDDSDSYIAEPLPFKAPEKIREYELKEIRRRALGESTRKGKIIPSSKAILKEIQTTKFNNPEDKRIHLFFKARQWCEVNKALVIDSKYPKINPSIFRDKYSEEHKKASLLSRGGKKVQRMFIPEPVSPFPIPLELLDKRKSSEVVLPGYQGMAKVVQEEQNEQAELRKELSQLFQDIKPLPELQTKEEPWQFKATKTLLSKPKAKKKPAFKRTEYPPKSKEQKITELRKLLPKLKPLHMQTDYLSGIWEPGLMTESFVITPLNYDSRIETMKIHDEEDEDKKETRIDWYCMNEAKLKCKNWLKNIPD